MTFAATTRFAAMGLILALLLWVGLVAGSDQDRALRTIENLYADVMDAHYILSTIDSGLFSSYRGKDRKGWKQAYEQKKEQLARCLARFPAGNLSPTDRRALSIMRKNLASALLNTADSRPADRCSESSEPDLDRLSLRGALYSCFDQIGNRLEFESTRVNRVSALALLAQLPETARRKQLFFAFEPLWQAVNGHDQPDSPYRRLVALAADDAAKNGSRIEDAARTVGAQPQQIESWLEQILDTWRQVTPDQALEPWDYHYTYSEADRLVKAAIPLAGMERTTERYYHDLGADLNGLGVLHDLDPRPGKAPLAYTDFVSPGRMIDGAWRPSVVRVSANNQQGSLGQLNELVHEYGHAVHMMALRSRPAFMDLGDDLFVEAFADVTSWDTYDPAWQRRYLGRSAPLSISLQSLYCNVMLDVAWGLFELRMLHNPHADPNAVWTDITSHYLHIVRHPELSWWALRVQLVDVPGYMINYGLGAVLTADLRHRLAESLGAFATGNPQWYPWISRRLLHFGTERETAVLLRDFLGRPVSPGVLLADLRRLAKHPG